jgi:hypothetical protein
MGKTSFDDCHVSGRKAKQQFALLDKPTVARHPHPRSDLVSPPKHFLSGENEQSAD